MVQPEPASLRRRPAVAARGRKAHSPPPGPACPTRSATTSPAQSPLKVHRCPCSQQCPTCPVSTFLARWPGIRGREPEPAAAEPLALKRPDTQRLPLRLADSSRGPVPDAGRGLLQETEGYGVRARAGSPLQH